MKIGSELEGEAIQRGISHHVAAETIGVSQATFSRWVKGENIPHPQYWTPIARFLHIPKDQVGNLCAKERTQRGQRGMRRATDDLIALRRQVQRMDQKMNQILETLGLE